MKNLIQKEEHTLRHICDSYGIEIIFIFGSHAKNRATTKSDLDIGVYLGNRISTMKIWELQCSFMDIYKRCDIDLIILNDASPLLLFDLLINHKIIYMKDERVLHNFNISYLLAEDFKRRLEQNRSDENGKIRLGILRDVKF